MAVGLLGNKIGMSQIFNKKGELIPVTIIKCGPCTVTQILLKEINNYNAIQLGYLELTNIKALTKPEIGHFTKNNLACFYYLREYKVSNPNNYIIGQVVNLSIFKIGDMLKISALSTGKGYTGNIKRNNFSRGPMSHGSKHHRLQGSLGAGTDPGRVFPGKKMSGRSGTKMCTLSGLEIINIDILENLIFIKGNIPGKKGNLINLVPNK